MTDECQIRTLTEASNDLAYDIRLHERHARLLKRTRAALAFIALCGGASAFATVFNASPWLRGIGGLLVAACAFIDIIGDFAAQAAVHNRQRARYLELQANIANLTLAEVDAAVARIAQDAPVVIEALCIPAMNDVLRSRGYEDSVRPLGLLERAVDVIA